MASSAPLRRPIAQIEIRYRSPAEKQEACRML